MRKREENRAENHPLIPLTEETRGGVGLAEAAGLLMGIMRDCRDLFKDVRGELDRARDGRQMTPASLDISRLFRGPGRRAYPKVESFHKEVSLDDVKGVSELVSMMTRVGGKGKR